MALKFLNNAIFAGTITTSDNSNDNYIAATFSDSSYVRMHGYGLYMSRAHSYIRPTSDNSKTLYLGTSSERWSNIQINTPTATFSGYLKLSGPGDASGRQIHFLAATGESNTEPMRIVRYQDKMYFTYGTNSGDDAFWINSDGTTQFEENATFAGNVRVSGWIKGASDTNTLYSSTSLGTYLQSPTNSGTGGHIYFRNTSGTVFQTFSQIDGSATFAGDVTTSGSINVNRLAGGTPYDNFKISTVDIVTTLERVENTGDANAGYGRLDFKTNAAIGHTNAGRGGFKFIDGGGNDILYLDNKDKSATFDGNVSLADNKKLTFGAAPDFEIYHNSTTNVNHISSLLSRQLSISADSTTFAGANTYNKIQTYYSGSYISGWKFSDYNGGIWYDAGADDLTLNAGHANSQMLLNSGGAIALTLDASQNATFAGNATVNGGQLYVQNAVNPLVYLNDTNAGAGIFQQEGNTTRIGSDSNTQVVLVQNNATAVTIDTSKNVGIGTTSPDYQLEVENTSAQATLGITGGNTDARLYLKNNEGAWLIQNDYSNTGALSFYNSTHRVVITEGGNVGIGTTSPGAKLDVSGTGQIQSKITSTDNNGARFDLHSSGGQRYSLQSLAGVGGDFMMFDETSGHLMARYGEGASGYWQFHTNGTEKMRINSGGNVGIGTASPQSGGGSASWLSLNGTAAYSGGVVYTIGSTTKAYSYFESDYLKQQAQTGFGQKFIVNGTNTAMTILSGGNVGIGTTSPNYKLASYSSGDEFAIVAGAANAVGEFTGIGLSGYIATNAAVKAGLVFERETSWGIGKMHFLNNNTLGDSDATLSDSKMTIDSSGNVGIGTTTPTARLDILTNSATGNNDIDRYVRFRADNGEQRFAFSVGRSGNNSALQMYDSSEVQKVNIASGGTSYFNGGNVGIGTTSPGAPLEVRASASTPYAALRLSASSTKWWQLNTVFSNTNPDLFFAPNGGTATVTFQQTGNVGIGTTGPSAKLDIKGDGADIFLQSNDFKIARIQPRGTGSNLDKGLFSLFDGSTEDVRIDTAGNSWLNGGNVGIGTTSPSYKLSVSGAIEAGGVVTYSKVAGSGLNTTGDAVAGLIAGFNGASAGFEFKCYGGTGHYQRISYSCYCDGTTWRPRKMIDEGSNTFDVTASADGATITFTFKTRSGSQAYSPRVVVQATGHSINSTYA